jgi:hypothetical protein
MPYRCRRAAASLAAMLGACQASAPGCYNLIFENDTFAGQDSSYTNGIGLSWTSCAIAPDDPAAAVVEALDWLPGVGEPGHTHHVGLQLAHAMFTPADIGDPDPPPDSRPYAGVLALDSSLYAADEDSLAAWTLMLGIVGPSSGAGTMQELNHEWIGAATPRGWHHQLHDEPLLDVRYDHAQRLLDGHLGGLESDLTANIGGALGNFATYANLGATWRIGDGLPHSFGSPSIRAGTNSNAVLLAPIDAEWGWLLMASVQGFAVGHFLPQDGNTWRDSRSVDTEPWVAAASAGVAFYYRRLLVTVTYSRFNDTFVTQSDEFEYGSITLSLLPAR